MELTKGQYVAVIVVPIGGWMICDVVPIGGWMICDVVPIGGWMICDVVPIGGWMICDVVPIGGWMICELSVRFPSHAAAVSPPTPRYLQSKRDIRCSCNVCRFRHR